MGLPLNKRMNHGIQEGIAATASAREDRHITTGASVEATQQDIKQHRRSVQTAFFTPVDRPSRKQPTQAELDAEFAIPAHVLKKQDAPDL
ncbi:hypothetical protein GCM10027082_00110 [Comamonas humi]